MTWTTEEDRCPLAGDATAPAARPHDGWRQCWTTPAVEGETPLDAMRRFSLLAFGAGIVKLLAGVGEFTIPSSGRTYRLDRLPDRWAVYRRESDGA